MPAKELVRLVHVNGCTIALYLPVAGYCYLSCLLHISLHVTEIPLTVQQLVILAAAIVECGSVLPVPVGHKRGSGRKLSDTKHVEIPMIRQ